MVNYYDALLASKLGGGSASLQTKSVEITQNGDSTILPDEGYDGLGSVALSVNVSGGGIPEVPDDALLFWAMYPFTLETYNKTKNWDGKILYSSDYSTWVEWDGVSKISSAADGGCEKLYLRGVGNTKVGGNSPQYRWVIDGSAYCCGNIDNLLDYSAPVSMAPYALGHLFYETKSVDFDCILPSLVLPEGAYYGMFNGSLVTHPPKIMATTMGMSCCEMMFRNCTALAYLPAISALSLSAYSCGEMFRGCTKIKLSTVQSDEYINEFRIPITGTGSANNSLTNMFSSTGGTFTGTPTINTTYYTSNTVISPT